MQNGPHGPVFHEFLTRREGFEPSVRLHVRLISSQVHSTTLPPLRSAEAAIVAVIFGPPTKNEDLDEIVVSRRPSLERWVAAKVEAERAPYLNLPPRQSPQWRTS